MTPSDRRSLIAVLAGALLVGAYVFSFVYSQAKPQPRHLPVALSGPRDQVDQARDEIERSTGTSFEVHVYDGETRARRAIRDRDVYAALILSKAKPRLLTAPAAGGTAATIVERRLPRAAGLAAAGMPEIERVVPLDKDDPDGQAMNLMILPLVIFGIVVPVLLSSVGAAGSVRRRLLSVLLFSLLSGLAATLVANVWLDAVTGPFAAVAALAVLLVLGVSSCNLALIGLRGPVGASVAIVAFLIVGNVASGAAVVHELQPGFWRATGPWLPPGAAATAIRDVGYFDGAKLLMPLAVLIGYCAIGVASSLLLGGRRPAPQGDPAGPTANTEEPAAAEA